MRLGGLSKKLMAVALSSVMVMSGFAGLAPAVSVSAADDTAKLRMQTIPKRIRKAAASPLGKWQRNH